MYATWNSESSARAAIAARRRQRANRRTIAATSAALLLGWLLNAGSVVVSLPVEDQSTALRNYASFGVVIGAVVAVAVWLTILSRALEARFQRFLGDSVAAGQSRSFEAVAWYALTAVVSGLMGSAVALGVGPLGISRLQAGLTVGVPLMCVFLIARYLIPADKRLEVTTQIVRESRRADELAALSEGEQMILERLTTLQELANAPQASGLGARPDEPQFNSWTAWWAARPNRRWR